MKKVLYALIFIAGVLAGLTGSYYVNRSKLHTALNTTTASTRSFSEIRSGGYKYTNPLLECDSTEDISPILDPLKTKLNQIKTDAKDRGEIQELSVYFRDLNSGPWFGIDETKTFTPASMFKLPLAMSIYKTAETKPEILTENILYDKPVEGNIQQNIPPEKQAQVGHTYSIPELISDMLIYSDNISTILLSNALNNSVNFSSIFEELHMPYEPNNQGNISTKSFATLYRMLYNSSYLTKQDSEHVLDVLTQSHEEKSLFDGVPDSIPVAAKFGERAYTENSTIFLHNCGIVYYPKHPYLLCVMTKGNSRDKQASVIKEISKTTYQTLDSEYSKTSMKK